MMANDIVSLPCSSISEIIKIVVGYANARDETTLDDLSKLIGMNKTSISSNNQFLIELGLIEGGKTKHPTELGSKLGRALEHRQDEDVREHLSQIVSENTFLSKLVTTVRIKRKMSTEEFLRHIMYASGQSDSQRNKTGSRSILDLLLMSGAIKEVDGQLEVSTGSNQLEAATEKIEENINEAQLPKADVATTRQATGPSEIKYQATPTIAINIQLQLPESDNADVYEHLFKALRRHLIDGQE